MENNKPKIKTNKVARYDRDDKVVVVNVTQESPIIQNGKNIGHKVVKAEERINSQEMRSIYNAMVEEKKKVEGEIKRLTMEKDKRVSRIGGFTDEELEELQKKFESLQEFQKRKKDDETIVSLQDRAKMLAEDMNDLRKVVDKIPKV